MAERGAGPGFGTFDIAQLVAQYLRQIIPQQDLERFAGGDEREAWRRKYWHDPVAFARDHYRWDKGRFLAPYQQDTLNTLAAHKRIATYGCRGNGKTTVTSHAILWFALTRDGFTDWKCPVTAGGYRQLEKYLFPEVHKWARRLRWDRLGRRPFSRRDELMQLSLRLETGEAFGAASDDANLIEGAHATQLLFVLDESKSIADSVWDSIEGTLTGGGLDDSEAYVLATSTPGGPVGRFWQICDEQPGFEEWKTRHVTIQEAIKAGRVPAKWAENRIRQWGINSSLAQNHVFGRFAATSADGVLPTYWVEEAMGRRPQDAHGPREGGDRVVFGVDVSRGGHNESVIAVRKGWAITEIIAFQSNDTVKVTQRIKDAAARHGPTSIIVDVVGVGAGVFDNLRAEDFPVVPFHGGEIPPGKDSTGEIEFLNRRAWAYWHLRELLHPHGPVKLSFPEKRDDSVLLTQASVITYAKTASDKLKVEDKDDIEKRLRKLNPHSTDSLSPDRIDAIMMAFSDAETSIFEDHYAAYRPSDLVPPRPPNPQEALVAAELAAEEARRVRLMQRIAKARPDAVQHEQLMFGGAARAPKGQVPSWWTDGG